MVAPAAPLNLHQAVEFRGDLAKLWDDPSGEVVISGPSGTGKTRGILEWINLRCQQTRLRVLILRKTQESAKASVLVTFREQVLLAFDGKRSLPDAVSYFGGSKLLPAQFTYHRTRSTIDIGGMDNVAKVLSTEYDIIFVNEVTELLLSEWEQLTGRTDRPSLVARPPNLVLGDCNPDAPTHWIKRREAAGALILWTSIHEDNPAMWDADARRWREAGLRYLARLDKHTGVRRLRMRFGRWAAAEGQVLDAWDSRRHVIARDRLKEFGLAKPKRVIAGVDWGWTNPGVITVAAIGGDTQVGLLHEVYRTKQGRDWWIAQATTLKAAYGIETFYCDPSEPELIDAWDQAGLNAEPAVNDILPGITAIQDRLAPDASGRVRWVAVDDLNPEPEQLDDDDDRPVSGLQEVERYVWPITPTSTMNRSRREKPVDKDNHAMDTWRYIAMEANSGHTGFEDVPDDLQDTFARLGV